MGVEGVLFPPVLTMPVLVWPSSGRPDDEMTTSYAELVVTTLLSSSRLDSARANRW